MLIESIIKRAKGHAVTLGGKTYEFRPDGTPPYAADVTDEDHIATLLAIREGYKVHFIKGAASGSGDTNPAKGPDSVAPADTVLLGSDVHPSHFEIGDTGYALGDVVRLAFTASGLSAEKWNALGEGERADLIDDALEELNAKVGQSGESGSTDPEAERDALVEQYQARFGKKPHGKWTAERIRAELAE